MEGVVERGDLFTEENAHNLGTSAQIQRGTCTPLDEFPKISNFYCLQEESGKLPIGLGVRLSSRAKVESTGQLKRFAQRMNRILDFA